MNNKLTLTYSSSLTHLKTLNQSFDSGILRVAHTGPNRNNSDIAKEVFESALPTIYNCPIVCNYIRDEDEIGGHDVDLVKTDTSIRIVHATHPVGVIPESAKYWWEEVEDSTGTHEYLCIEALLWRRQEAYTKIKENGITDESMEITVKAGKMIDGRFSVDEFEFNAFCLLERDRPCFESASLQLFSSEEFRSEFNEMLKDFKLQLEGARILNENMASAKQEFSLSAEQFRDELVLKLRDKQVETNWGKSAQYVYIDYDPEKQEVYCYDTADAWRVYGLKYEANNDDVVVDFDSKVRKKCTFVDFMAGTEELSFSAIGQHIDLLSTSLNEKYSQEKNELEGRIEKLKTDNSTLQQFQQEKLQQERTAAEQNLFTAFSDLTGNADFEALKAACQNYSVDELEEKCFAIRGKTALKFSGQADPVPSTPKLMVEKPITKDDEPYGGLFTKYGY